MSSEKKFFIIKRREPTRTENKNKFSVPEFLYSRNPSVQIKNINAAFKARMITRPYEFDGAEPGYYTWIMRQKNKDSKVKLYALKALSKQEIGTLHLNLDMYSDDPDPIIGAGELLLEPPYIYFNFLSGSFMVPILSRLGGKVAENDKIEDLKKIFKGLFEHTGLRATFFNCEAGPCNGEQQLSGKKLIEAANIRTSLNNLIFLRQFFSSPINAELNKIIERNKSELNQGNKSEIIKENNKVVGGKTRRKGNRKVYRHKRKTRKQ